MQKKLYKVMTILVSCTVLFFLLVAGSLGYSTYQRFTKNELNPLQSSLPQETINPQKWLIFWKDQ
ncbi:hypothetical protein DXA02_07355 [Ruminococcus sp. AM54-1NS]|nr:hypothetical protein DXA02_07355 [Ruminococcus sp. AM54-1NS]